MRYKLFLLILPALLLSACGKGVVDVTRESYEPKIVVEGLLIAGQPVGKIHLTRNFPVDADLRHTPLIDDVEATTAVITEVESGTAHALYFVAPQDDGPHVLKDYYWTTGDPGFIIKHGQSYRLDISMPIEGQPLTASAVTHVPGPGLALASLNTDTLPYRAVDEDNEIRHFKLQIDRVPGIDLYMTTLVCHHAVMDSLIMDNPYEEIDADEAEEDMEEYGFEVQWIQNTPQTAGRSPITIYWYQLYFYGDYTLTVHAVDRNYARFIQTFDNVQEMDGNFHEAYIHLDGDGIGYFGSASIVTQEITVTH